MTDPLARELLSVIALAMTCPDAAVGMEILGDGVGVVLAGRRGNAMPQHTPTPLRPEGWDEPPPDTESAEYHYAMAEREREARGE